MEHHLIYRATSVLAEIENIKKELGDIKEIVRMQAEYHDLVTQEHQTKKLAAQKVQSGKFKNLPIVKCKTSKAAEVIDLDLA